MLSTSWEFSKNFLGFPRVFSGLKKKYFKVPKNYYIKTVPNQKFGCSAGVFTVIDFYEVVSNRLAISIYMLDNELISLLYNCIVLVSASE